MKKYESASELLERSQDNKATDWDVIDYMEDKLRSYVIAKDYDNVEYALVKYDWKDFLLERLDYDNALICLGLISAIERDYVKKGLGL